MGSRRASVQSGADYSPSVPMVTVVSKGEGRRSHPGKGPEHRAGCRGSRWPDLMQGSSLPGLGSPLLTPHTHYPLQKPLLLVSAPVRSDPAHCALGHRARRLQLRRGSLRRSYGGTSGSKRELEPRPSCPLGGRGLGKESVACSRSASDWASDACGGGAKK